MNKPKSLALALAGATLMAVSTQAGVLTVDDDHAQCVDAQYSSIQAAVLAAKPGDTINVCPGTYQEQVTISKNLKIQGVDIADQNLALIKPNGVVANSTSLSSSAPIAAIVLVTGANSVSLTNLTVDGSTSGITGCAPNLVGVYYRNASGKMDSMAVRNIKLGTGLEGCQSGLAVFAQSGGGGSSRLELINSSIHDYQKNGITANEAGTELVARGNAVSGIGTTPSIAQNGIQVGFGAKGLIESNSVINHVYGLCIDPETCGAASTNVLVFDAGSTKVIKNSLGKAQVNVDAETNGAEITDNFIFDTDVFDGVFVGGNDNKVQNNTIMNSDEAAVFVDGNNNKVVGNTINEAPVGVFQTATSAGTNVNGNKFYNVRADTTTETATAALTLSAIVPRAGHGTDPARP